MSQKTAAIIGASGLIGSEVLAILKHDQEYETIRLIVRWPVTDSHPKIEMKLVNFEDYESLKLAIDGCDVVFCAVGTTQKKVKGDKLAYRKVDYDIPVNAARACLETKCEHFLLVSSVGANVQSNNFYLKLKGEVEDAIQKISIPSISIFRPSVLLGRRKESRIGEHIGQTLMKVVSPLLGGKRSKYKPIAAKDVAAAMIKAAKKRERGYHVYEYQDMNQHLA
jgi:uncharacterized protein YbjT (DUF2867 family)